MDGDSHGRKPNRNMTDRANAAVFAGDASVLFYF